MERLRSLHGRYTPGELGRLLDAVTALESLFLSDGLKDELKFRLQIRAAKFLETDPLRRKEIVEKLGKIYDLRSALVHQGKVSKKLRTSQSELNQKQFGSSKRSITVFFDFWIRGGRQVERNAREVASARARRMFFSGMSRWSTIVKPAVSNQDYVRVMRLFVDAGRK